MRRIRLFMAFFGLLGLLALGGGAQVQRVTLMLEWFPNPDHVALFAARERGFFAQEGLEVAFQVPTDPNVPLRATGAGSTDFAINYAPNVVIGRSQGLPVVSMGALIPNTLAAVMFLKESGIKSPGDLKGKTIGVSVTPLYEVLLQVVAESGGLKRGDWRTVFVGFNLVPALLNKQVDAISGAFRNFEPVVASLAKKESDVSNFEDFGVPRYDELVIITRDELVKTKPELIRRFMRAVVRGIAFTLENPAEALALFFRANPDLDDELNRRALSETLPYFGSPWQLRERWERLAKFMLERGLIEKAVKVDELFTNEFLPR